MNRPTIDVDEYLELADEALEAGDFSQAVTILRKATSVAPLRKDIRNRLAIALEGTPISRSPRRVHSVQDQAVSFEHDSIEFDGETLPGSSDNGNGREAIGEIARKAFEAAAGQTARAGVATRNLTNLLQHGIQTWKSSLSEQMSSKTGRSSAVAKGLDSDAAVSGATQANVFTPEKDLNEYLNKSSATNRTYTPASNSDHDEEPFAEQDDVERIAKPAGESRKAAKPNTPSRKSSRPTDVEDVLAAGIGGFIEAVSQANKTKILYGFVYVAMVGLFGFACFDVANKFPGVEAVPGGQLSAAGLGSLNLTESRLKTEAITEAKQLVAQGKPIAAIMLLRKELESGRFLHNRDMLRIELAALLNSEAEEHLRANRFDESVKFYREANQVLPSDSALKLRLSNALYYQGTLGTAEEAAKESALKESSALLEALASNDDGNLQVHRLLALVQDALGQSKSAKASWKKVKASADANSAELQEAESHLK